MNEKTTIWRRLWAWLTDPGLASCRLQRDIAHIYRTEIERRD